jgi:hypothetical protein
MTLSYTFRNQNNNLSQIYLSCTTQRNEFSTLLYLNLSIQSPIFLKFYLFFFLMFDGGYGTIKKNAMERIHLYIQSNTYRIMSKSLELASMNVS